MLISVIVPVYNTECYLPMCLDSILGQTHREIEVILVDDGSGDKSLNICMESAKRDSRVIVIKSKHQGSVSARKLGAERATGEYCMFVDSDDWIKKNLIESLLQFVVDKSTDIVNYNMSSVEGNHVTDWKYSISEGVYERQQLVNIYKKMMFDFEKARPGIIQSLCTKLIKRNILMLSMEGIDDRFAMGDDAAVVYKAMLIADKVVVIHKSFYFYRIHPFSMCHTKEENPFFKIECFQKYMQSIFSKYDMQYKLNEQLKMYLMSFIKKAVADTYGIGIVDLYRLPFRCSDIGKRVVLYGAGRVGKAYYRQLAQMQFIRIAAWIDKGKVGQSIFDYEIQAIEDLRDREFDKIIIGVKDTDTAEEIRKELSTLVPARKILWKEPLSNWWEREIVL